MKRKIPNVFESKMHGTKCWCCDLRYHGGKREYFKTEAEAQGRAEEEFNKIFNRIETSYIPPDVVLDAKRGYDLLKPFGATVWQACQEYAAKLAKNNVRITLDNAIEQWLSYKDRTSIRDSSRANIKTRTTAFSQAFCGKSISEIDHDSIHAWLHELPLSAHSKLSYRTTLYSFFQWCIFPKKWIAQNPCTGITFKIEEKEVEIFSIKEAETVWQAAQSSDEDIKLWIALCMFCGLRANSEAKKVCIDDVGENEIRVHSGKTGRFRYVRMEEGVREILINDKWSGKLIKPTFQRRWDLFRYNLGYKVWVNPLYKAFKPDPNYDKRPLWPHNVMRHTYCSYHLACFQNEALTAHMAGHDVKVLRKYYRRPIPKSEGERFWKIVALN